VTAVSARTGRAGGDPVADRFGIRLDELASNGFQLTELVDVGLRRNPRRAQLLVSRVLGKHVPVDPALVLAVGARLGDLVRAALGGAAAAVLGYAETATGLGHAVAAALAAPYLHSTRRAVPTARPWAEFAEAHSHATGHLLLPDPGFALAGDVLVLVDDELSTGATARDTIRAVHAVAPRGRYLIAALVDVRSDVDRARLRQFAAELGAAVDVVAVACGALHLPDGLPDLVAGLPDVSEPPAVRPAATLTWHRGCWPATARESARHGFTPADDQHARTSAAGVADRLRHALSGRSVLVVGTEELMYVPTLLAAALRDHGSAVRVCSTTRSPVRVLDEPGYPIRAVLSFPSSDPAADGAGPRFLYNVPAGEFDEVVLVVDAAADTPDLRDGLVTELRKVTGALHVVVVPTTAPLPEPLHGPAFGSYPAAEVSWLLTDLSAVRLEAPTEEREEAIQSGGAHYAESLPVEYQPDAEYRQLFEQALAASAERVAEAVGVVTELLLAARGDELVLASLARAGTPVGVLIRRWARFAHGLELPHATVSIVRGRGIDTVALRWLAQRHGAHRVAFVDGWTGKGAIVRELAAAVQAANHELGAAFDPALAVLADPGSCVRIFGTRDDFLVPSACLNSTVSGLVSRTVLNPAVLAPGSFHGAKFYRDLAGDDVSARFLDAVTDRFPEVAAAVATRWPAALHADREPTWAGWRAVERISEGYGIDDVTLVKPGVGETTRVLLRRVPWAVLSRPDAGAEVAHVRLLAERRGVPVHDVEDLPYRCVGLIHPRFTRGATGADGTAVRR
jgi:adenine/guanine phosphoribosyltransferase-like PRPP-binding protein